MQERCFVAGATGYTGRELVRLLCERGARVVAHVRPDSARLEEWRARFEALGAEVSTAAWDHASMSAALRELAPTQLYCMIGTTRRRARHDATGASSYASVDLGLTQLLLGAAGELSDAPLFVYLSSIGAEPRPRGAYLLTRRAAEQALRASGLPHLIARPSVIHGPARDEPRALEALGARVLGVLTGVAHAIGARELARRYAPVTPTELARALVHAAGEPSNRGLALEGENLFTR